MDMQFNTFGKADFVAIVVCFSFWVFTFFDFSPDSSSDAFDDAGDGGNGAEEKIHVRVQQRNGRKCITTVAGLADDLDIKRICKAFKKNFSCNGAVQADEDAGEVIQLSGDQRTNVKGM